MPFLNQTESSFAIISIGSRNLWRYRTGSPLPVIRAQDTGISWVRASANEHVTHSGVAPKSCNRRRLVLKSCGPNAQDMLYTKTSSRLSHCPSLTLPTRDFCRRDIGWQAVAREREK